MRVLTGAEIEAAARIVVGTMGLDEFESLVYSTTGDRLFAAYASRDWPLLRIVRTTLDELTRTGQVHVLLNEVVARRPQRPDVRDALAPLLAPLAPTAHPDSALNVQRGGQADPEAPKEAAAPGLQRNVRPHLTKLDIRVWLERAAEIEKRVCRVELDGNALGTGFLVGRDAVLTNWHVVKAAQESGKLGQVECRFDYVKLPGGGRQEGTLFALAAKPLIDSSPYAPAEITATPDTPPPTASQLDYALLRLAEPLGDARGWIALPARALPLPAGSPILILQHPDGAPMKLALDTDGIIGRNAGKTRIRYHTNTEPGSSGSPCFTMDWELVALHHLGDPAWVDPVYNQGVPAELIRRRITGRKLGAALGAATAPAEA